MVAILAHANPMTMLQTIVHQVEYIHIKGLVDMQDLGMPSKALSDDKRHKTQELFHMPGDWAYWLWMLALLLIG
ncbi:hypothetical protein HanHA300_Chr10g0381791 [Helianthus annuus]|nr:hypothetical protein HanHA300_Chr10g0381791 [Helianthus annuus]KAJ0531739.1 hypothetical protein HanHA89_Chr10g0404261 [Helianthus annuus]KAJ0701935.1 hypothetical protein HanOQP8_Chr10g0384741 [Helianthus annuus]